MSIPSADDGPERVLTKPTLTLSAAIPVAPSATSVNPEKIFIKALYRRLLQASMELSRLGYLTDQTQICKT